MPKMPFRPRDFASYLSESVTAPWTSNLASNRNNFIEIQNGIIIESLDMTPTVSVRNALFQEVLFDGIRATERANLEVELSEFSNCGVNGIDLPFVVSFRCESLYI